MVVGFSCLVLLGRLVLRCIGERDRIEGLNKEASVHRVHLTWYERHCRVLHLSGVE